MNNKLNNIWWWMQPHACPQQEGALIQKNHVPPCVLFFGGFKSWRGNGQWCEKNLEFNLSGFQILKVSGSKKISNKKPVTLRSPRQHWKRDGISRNPIAIPYVKRKSITIWDGPREKKCDWFCYNPRFCDGISRNPVAFWTDWPARNRDGFQRVPQKNWSPIFFGKQNRDGISGNPVAILVAKSIWPAKPVTLLVAELIWPGNPVTVLVAKLIWLVFCRFNVFYRSQFFNQTE